MEAVYKIHYLKSSLGKELFSEHDHLKIESYTNADGLGQSWNRGIALL